MKRRISKVHNSYQTTKLMQLRKAWGLDQNFKMLLKHYGYCAQKTNSHVAFGYSYLQYSLINDYKFTKDKANSIIFDGMKEGMQQLITKKFQKNTTKFIKCMIQTTRNHINTFQQLFNSSMQDREYMKEILSQKYTNSRSGGNLDKKNWGSIDNQIDIILKFAITRPQTLSVDQIIKKNEDLNQIQSTGADLTLDFQDDRQNQTIKQQQKELDFIDLSVEFNYLAHHIIEPDLFDQLALKLNSSNFINLEDLLG